MSTGPSTSKDSDETPKLDRFSKENRWYYNELDNHLLSASRELLENYSHIQPQDVDEHVYKMRDSLWSYAPYPCIGEFKFMTLNLPKHPLYFKVLSLLEPSDLASQFGPYMFDLGCCVAQELRSLVHSGIPSAHLYGSDLVPSFLHNSYDLFNDAGTFKGTLIPADIFSPSLFADAFKGLEHKFRVLHAGLFLHLFSWEQQLHVCQIVVQLLSQEKGTLFLGEMVGCEGSGERGEGPGSKFWTEGEERKQFLHDAESFNRMWNEIEKLTATEGLWKVEVMFEKRKGKADGSQGCAFFVGKGIGWLTFAVEHV